MWNKIANFSAVAGLLGIGATSFMSDATSSHLALAAFCLALLFLTFRATAALRAWQNRNYPKGYIPVATFIRYRTSDGLNLFYETFRHIQIKTAYMKSFRHRFFWTGSKTPNVESSLQKVGALTGDNPAKPKTVELEFKEYRRYNDTEIVHVEMQLDDSDQQSQTFVCATVDSPMRFIHFRVELLHYNKANQYGKTAILGKRSIGANEHAGFSLIKQVSFNPLTKSYECIVPHPEPGFKYQLSWERIPVHQPKSKP